MKFVNLLIKPASSLCNLRCKYCFYEDEAKNRVHYSMGVMREELANVLIQRAFEAVDPDGIVSFAFQGGEPTVAGLPFFRHFVEETKQRKPPKVQMRFSIQTNGTLLNADWAKLFKEEHFLVGLSLDGFRDAHEAHRVDGNGGGTWKQVLAAKRMLDEHRVDYNVLCVVTNLCAGNPERTYKSLKNLGFRYIQFIACLDPIGRRGQEPWSLAPDAYGKFLCQVFDMWYRDWITGDYHSVRLFDDFIHILLGDGASTCATCGKCGVYFVVEGDGSVYPCDFYVLDNWKLGNILEMPIAQMAGSEKAAAFLSRSADKPRACAACSYGAICGGGCKNDWFTDKGETQNYNCTAFKMLLRHALPRMRQIAQAEIAARDARAAGRLPSGSP